MPTFRLSGTKLLAVDIHGETFRALTGSMVAYDGNIQFKKQGMGASGGIRSAMKRKITGESISLMEVTGQGTCYIANMANEINLVELRGEKMFVEASNLVALDNGLKTNQVFNGLRGASTGQGLFTTTVEGAGTAAIVSDGPAIILEVSHGMPLCVDPQAYVAHTGQLQQDFITDVNWRMAVGQGSGEAFQLRFQGQGLVYIQPAERAAGIDV
jgi:uncharacterized protein (AIM24 family)